MAFQDVWRYICWDTPCMQTATCAMKKKCARMKEHDVLADLEDAASDDEAKAGESNARYDARWKRR